MDLTQKIMITMSFNFDNVGTAQDSVKALLGSLKNWEENTVIRNRGGSNGVTHDESVSIEIPITNSNEVKRIKDKITKSLDDGDFTGYVGGSLRIAYTAEPAPIVVDPVE